MLTLRLEWLASIAGLQLELLQCCMSQLLSVGVHRSKGHRLFIRHRYWRALHRYGRVLHRLLTRRCRARSRWRCDVWRWSLRRTTLKRRWTTFVSDWRHSRKSLTEFRKLWQRLRLNWSRNELTDTAFSSLARSLNVISLVAVVDVLVNFVVGLVCARSRNGHLTVVCVWLLLSTATTGINYTWLTDNVHKSPRINPDMTQSAINLSTATSWVSKSIYIRHLESRVATFYHRR